MARLTIVGGRIVDVAGNRTGEPCSIVIDGGLIAAIRPVAPAEGEVLDATGRFVAPGLIDGHVHLAFDAGANPLGVVRRGDAAEIAALIRANARAALGAGVTTVRDLGAPLSAMLDARPPDPGPDVVFAGAAVTRPGGHLAALGGEVVDAGAARRLLERQIEAGALAIKVVISGGGLTPGTRPDRAELPPAIVRAAVEVGRAHGVPVAAHAHASAAIRRAIDAGVATIEHLSFLDPSGRPAFDPELARRMRDRGIAAVPTAVGALRTAERYRSAGPANEQDRHAVERLTFRGSLAGLLEAAGVEVIMGTDAGVIDTPFDSLHDELAVAVAGGMSPVAALRSATSGAARGLGLLDRGRVAVGLRADLLVVDRDPLLDLATLRQPGAIVANGRLVRAAR